MIPASPAHYIHRPWDRVRKSQGAAVLLSWMVLLAIVTLITVTTAVLLTYVGLHAFHKCRSHQEYLLDNHLLTRSLCANCQPMPMNPDTYVCAPCDPMHTFTELQQQTEHTAQLQTAQAIHESLGWLWDWCNITWPTNWLTRWVLLLTRYSFLWSYCSMIGWALYLVYQVGLGGTQYGIHRFRTALTVADQTPPPGYQPRPSVAELTDELFQAHQAHQVHHSSPEIGLPLESPTILRQRRVLRA